MLDKYDQLPLEAALATGRPLPKNTFTYITEDGRWAAVFDVDAAIDLIAADPSLQPELLALNDEIRTTLLARTPTCVVDLVKATLDCYDLAVPGIAIYQAELGMLAIDGNKRLTKACLIGATHFLAYVLTDFGSVIYYRKGDCPL